MTTPVRPIILIVGPTAGGKTDLSIALAQRLPGGGEVISADSMQVYRGMDIGTAKPTLEERKGTPHHLIDIADPREPFSVDDWLDLAEHAIAGVRTRGAWPILVGGTNLYVKVFLEGMFKGPPADEALRGRLALEDSAALHERLKQVDPASAARLHVNDRKRLTRALEVYELTGEPISSWQTQWHSAALSTPPAGRRDVILLGLDWPAEEINRRINSRVKKMVEMGLVDEVRTLWQTGHLGRQAREALGYKQILEFLEGRSGLEDAAEQTKIESRRYARKQRTWLKRFRAYQPGRWFDAAATSPEDIVRYALEYIAANTTTSTSVCGD